MSLLSASTAFQFGADIVVPIDLRKLAGELVLAAREQLSSILDGGRHAPDLALSDLPPWSFEGRPDDDAAFYAEARLTHIDDGAIAALTKFYRRMLPAGGWCST